MTLSLCHGCDDIYDGGGDFCPHCRTHGLCDDGRKRNDFAARLTSAKPVQRDWLVQTLEAIPDYDAKLIILRLFEYAAPVERTVLLDIAAEIADVTPLREIRRCR